MGPAEDLSYTVEFSASPPSFTEEPMMIPVRLSSANSNLTELGEHRLLQRRAGLQIQVVQGGNYCTVSLERLVVIASVGVTLMYFLNMFVNFVALTCLPRRTRTMYRANKYVKTENTGFLDLREALLRDAGEQDVKQHTHARLDGSLNNGVVTQSRDVLQYNTVTMPRVESIESLHSDLDDM
jgi:hypothetical protein